MLVRRGKLASALNISWPTVKYYTEMGLFSIMERTPNGQYLYSLEDIKSRYKIIQNLKRQRFTIAEIKNRLILEEIG